MSKKTSETPLSNPPKNSGTSAFLSILSSKNKRDGVEKKRDGKEGKHDDRERKRDDREKNEDKKTKKKARVEPTTVDENKFEGEFEDEDEKAFITNAESQTTPKPTNIRTIKDTTTESKDNVKAKGDTKTRGSVGNENPTENKIAETKEKTSDKKFTPPRPKTTIGFKADPSAIKILEPGHHFHKLHGGGSSDARSKIVSEHKLESQFKTESKGSSDHKGSSDRKGPSVSKGSSVRKESPVPKESSDRKESSVLGETTNSKNVQKSEVIEKGISINLIRYLWVILRAL